MKLVYATMLSIGVLMTEANAQVIQDNFFGDNVNVTQQVNRPVVRQVVKKTRVVGKKVVNNYTTVIENNNTVVQQPTPAPVQQTTVVNVPAPVPVYVPPPPPAYGVYGPYLGPLVPYGPYGPPMVMPVPAYPYY